MGTWAISTLSAGSSYFSRIFSAEWAEEESEIFLDRDAEPFSILLLCMRSMSASLLPTDDRMFKRVLLEAEYFGVDWLITHVKLKTARAVWTSIYGVQHEILFIFDL